MNPRRRTTSLMLGLLVALAAVLGVARPCVQGQAMQRAAVPAAQGTPGDHVTGERVCGLHSQDQCKRKLAAGTPTTGPNPILNRSPHPVGRAYTWRRYAQSPAAMRPNPVHRTCMCSRCCEPLAGAATTVGRDLRLYHY